MSLKGSEHQTIKDFHREIYGFDSGEEKYPFFPALLEGASKVLEEVHKDNVEDIGWVRSALSFVKPICQKFGFEVLLADLTVIQDARLGDRSTNEDSYLVNYVLCYRELRNEPEIQKAYRRTLKFMGADEAGKDPLIPNPWFYQYAYLSRPVDSPTDGSSDLTSGDAPWQSAFRQRYPYSPGPGQQNVKTQLERLQRRFLEELKGAGNLFGGSILLAVPFRRSPFQPLMSGEPVEKKPGSLVTSNYPTPSPGGGLFLFIKPSGEPYAVKSNWDDQIERCAYRLGRFLMEAALAESLNQLNVQLDRQKQMYLAAHIVGNIIKSIGIGSLRGIINSLPNKQSLEVKALSSMANSLDLKLSTLAAMWALVEISGQEGEIPEKHQNSQGMSVRDIITQARDISNDKEEQTTATPKLVEISSSPSENWTLPKQYLDSAIVRGIVLEIFQNCSRHGEGKHRAGKEEVSVKVIFSQRNLDLIISIGCPCKDDGWTREDEDNKENVIVVKKGESRVSFLTRLVECCRGITGLGISSHIKRSSHATFYCTHLKLGGIRAQGKKGLTTVRCSKVSKTN